MNRFVNFLCTVLFIMITMIQPCTSLGAFMEMIFNNGTEPPKLSEPCTYLENKKIDSCFDATLIRRSLRASNNIATVNATHHQQQDQRQAYPLVCKALCAGCAPKTCRANQCKGYRRDLGNDLVVDSEENHGRSLFMDMALCNATIDATNLCLDTILSTVSRNCRAFYNPRLRTASCRLFELC